MATHKYKIYDRTTSQPVTAEIDSVLDVVTLANVATTLDSAEITCTSTTGVYPFMRCVGPNIPADAWVAAVKSSSNTLVLAMAAPRPATWVASKAYVVGDRVYHFATDMVWRCTVAHTSSSSNYKAGGFTTDVDAGKWTPVELPFVVPALATASASSLTAHCHGISPLMPEEVFPGTTWRNEFNPTLGSADLRYNGSSVVAVPDFTGGGFTPVPGSVMQVASAAIAVNDIRVSVPDSLAGIPERSRRVFQSQVRFIHTGGMYSQFPMTCDFSIVRTGTGT
jgi:hypothetical protein